MHTIIISLTQTGVPSCLPSTDDGSDLDDDDQSDTEDMPVPVPVPILRASYMALPFLSQHAMQQREDENQFSAGKE